jgi:hypothetical protein
MKPNIQIWPIERLKPYERNAKKHPASQVSKIAASIRQFGWTQAIVVDAAGVIIAGHGRRLAAIELGFKEVPVWVRDDLSLEEAAALRLADNRVAESEIDTHLLQAELRELDFDLGGIFDAKELEFFSGDLYTINDDAFVSDITAEVERQAEETAVKVREVDTRKVKIADALGIKVIDGKDERTLAHFMALIQSSTGKEGAEALIAHAEQVLSAS